MILYNWNSIVKSSKGNVNDIITILRIITYKITPKNYYDKTFKFYQKNFGGNSFLLHPEILLTKGRSQFSEKEVAEYVGVASFRNYYEYKSKGTITLDLIHCPVSQDRINENRLLKIEDGCIHFYFEETNGEKYGDWIQSN